jgi:hypothetical protein
MDLKIDKALLLEDESKMDGCLCPTCKMVIEEATSGCPDGHAFCHDCYKEGMKCPSCFHPMSKDKLQRNRTLEKLIGQFRMRCKHGPKTEPVEGEGGVGVGGGGEGGAAPQAKRAKIEGTRCTWEGKVCELFEHLAEDCALQPVECPNAAAGCTVTVLRQDAASHASQACAFRMRACEHCRNPFEARALKNHERSCPEAQVDCPNAGCSVVVLRKDVKEHRGGCEWEEVGCPCPG